jgi:hypothetical protein
LVGLFVSTPFLNNIGNGQHAVFALAFFAIYYGGLAAPLTELRFLGARPTKAK